MSHITIPYGPFEHGILEPIPRGLEKVVSKDERDQIVVACSILIGAGSKYFEIESGYYNGKKSWIICAYGGNLILDTQDFKDLQRNLQYLEHTFIGPISTSQQSKFFFQGKKQTGCLKIYIHMQSSSSSSSSSSSNSSFQLIKDTSEEDESEEDEKNTSKRYHQILHATKGGITKSIFKKQKAKKPDQLIFDETKASVLSSRGFATKLWEKYVLGIDDQEVETAVTEAFSSVRE